MGYPEIAIFVHASSIIAVEVHLGCCSSCRAVGHTLQCVKSLVTMLHLQIKLFVETESLDPPRNLVRTKSGYVITSVVEYVVAEFFQ